MALPVFLVPDRAWHATPRHVSPGHRARHVKTKTGHGVARVKISAPRVARHVPRRATFTRKRGVAWHGTPCHVPRRAMFSSAVFELQNYKFNAAQRIQNVVPGPGTLVLWYMYRYIYQVE